ncbi:hypothetical protein AB1M95_02060 [Sulfitobacter sp. LCG007]
MTQKGARFGCELVHQDRNAGFAAPKRVLEVLLECLSVGRQFPNLTRGLRVQRRRNEADLRQVILVVAVILVRVAGDGLAEMSWLADQTLEQVLAASEMIGGVLQHGHKVKLTRLSPAETEEATDIGFSVCSEGPDAVEEALDTIRQTSPANAVQAGPLAYYGALFDWLDRRSNSIDPGPIRYILRNHIVKHSAVEPGTTVLGAEITERRYHTLYSLAAVVGIDRSRLSRLLRKLGEIPANATEVDCGRMVFEAATAVPMVKAFKTAVPLRDVPEYIGASKRQVETLYREGIVLPLVPRFGPGSVRHVVFCRKHLDELLAKIASLPEADPFCGGDLHPIS